MKYTLTFLCSLFIYTFTLAQSTITISNDVLKDKIKGGWAGQTIGVTFGGPYEFRYNGTFIQDYQPLHWSDSYVKNNMTNNAGLYDDLYMDLTFVDIFDRYGLNAPVDSFANAFANAGYMLWHANQAARYNILKGIKAPQSGYWMNNPHADDIDYQIESDYAGLMSPAMPNTASQISDKIGHIMNYGDGWYGGVFIGAMYSLAFTSSDIPYIVKTALKTIPPQSNFYKCIADVIRWHEQYPKDWHRTWYELQNKWSNDMGCAEGVFAPFNIDAKINSAYVVVGLLYGGGDFTKTLDIATRCGQDADCNPSSAGGVLGTILGYNKIPDLWKQSLKDAEDINFKYTFISLNKVYDIGYKHAVQNILAHGGKQQGDNIIIVAQQPTPVKMEQCFPNMYPADKIALNTEIVETTFSFTGTGFIVSGDARKKSDDKQDSTIVAELYVDGKKVETTKLPTAFTTRRYELFWQYGLPNTKHTVTMKVLNQSQDYSLWASHYIYYTNKPLSANQTLTTF